MVDHWNREPRAAAGWLDVGRVLSHLEAAHKVNTEFGRTARLTSHPTKCFSINTHYRNVSVNDALPCHKLQSTTRMLSLLASRRKLALHYLKLDLWMVHFANHRQLHHFASCTQTRGSPYSDVKLIFACAELTKPNSYLPHTEYTLVQFVDSFTWSARCIFFLFSFTSISFWKFIWNDALFFGLALVWTFC